MPDLPEELNSSVTFYEPDETEIGYCRVCDVDISKPDATDGLCAVCEAKEEDGP